MGVRAGVVIPTARDPFGFEALGIVPICVDTNGNQDCDGATWAHRRGLDQDCDGPEARELRGYPGLAEVLERARPVVTERP